MSLAEDVVVGLADVEMKVGDVEVLAAREVIGVCPRAVEDCDVDWIEVVAVTALLLDIFFSMYSIL